MEESKKYEKKCLPKTNNFEELEIPLPTLQLLQRDFVKIMGRLGQSDTHSLSYQSSRILQECMPFWHPAQPNGCNKVCNLPNTVVRTPATHQSCSKSATLFVIKNPFVFHVPAWKGSELQDELCWCWHFIPCIAPSRWHVGVALSKLRAVRLIRSNPD